MQKLLPRLRQLFVAPRNFGQKIPYHSVHRRALVGGDDPHLVQYLVVDREGDVLHPNLHSHTNYVEPACICSSDGRSDLSGSSFVGLATQTRTFVSTKHWMVINLLAVPNVVGAHS